MVRHGCAGRLLHGDGSRGAEGLIPAPGAGRSEPIALAPLLAADLAAVEPWFDDPETRRWLGGRHWPGRSLALADPSAGRNVLKAMRGDLIVGLIDIEIGRDGRASFALVVDPGRRKVGIATATIAAALDHPCVAASSAMSAGVESGNDASGRLVRRSGFQPAGPPDGDGFTTFVLPLRA